MVRVKVLRSTVADGRTLTRGETDRISDAAFDALFPAGKVMPADDELVVEGVAPPAETIDGDEAIDGDFETIQPPAETIDGDDETIQPPARKKAGRRGRRKKATS